MFTLELLSGIWVGDPDILNSKKFMRDNEIKIILNCTQLFDFPDIPFIKKIRLPFSSTNNSETDLIILLNNSSFIILSGVII